MRVIKFRDISGEEEEWADHGREAEVAEWSKAVD